MTNSSPVKEFYIEAALTDVPQSEAWNNKTVYLVSTNVRWDDTNWSCEAYYHTESISTDSQHCCIFLVITLSRRVGRGPIRADYRDRSMNQRTKIMIFAKEVWFRRGNEHDTSLARCRYADPRHRIVRPLIRWTTLVDLSDWSLVCSAGTLTQAPDILNTFGRARISSKTVWSNWRNELLSGMSFVTGVPI